MSSDTFKIATGFLAEIDGEFPVTRKFLERLPADKLSWKPHEKSMSAGTLALHIAELSGAILAMGMQDSCEVPDLSNREEAKTVAQILTAFADSERRLRADLPTISDRRMHESVLITQDGRALATLPRVGFLRTILLNHLYHHRGQFGVYLRLIGCAVPASYGPSGDE